VDKATKIIVIASVLIIIVLAVFVFRGGGDDEARRIDIAKVERPKGRRPLGEAGKNGQMQEFVASSEESRQTMQNISKVFMSGDEERIADAIIEMESLGTEDMLALFDAAMRIKNPEYRRDVLTRIQALPHRGAVAALARAVNDSDPSVRQAAISALAITEGTLANEAENATGADKDRMTLEDEDKEQVASAIRQAVNDSDPEVRKEIMDSLPLFSADFQNYGINTAIEANDKEVRSDALVLVQGSYNKETITAAMTAIGDKDKQISEQAIDFLHHILGQEFSSAKEALEWWNQNSYKYDYDLVEQQEED